MRMFNDFYQTVRFVRSLNTSFLVMIPKKGGVEDFKDFRPISLVGSFYKLLAKVLANRLKGVMCKLMNKAHNAFVGGIQILDVSLITNKVIDSMKRKELSVNWILRKPMIKSIGISYSKFYRRWGLGRDG